MKIEFPTKYAITTYIPNQQFAVIQVPATYLQEAIEQLKSQSWITRVDVYPDQPTMSIRWSAAYEYPEGQPLAALHAICHDIISPEPKLDDVWSEALDEIDKQ